MSNQVYSNDDLEYPQIQSARFLIDKITQKKIVMEGPPQVGDILQTVAISDGTFEDPEVMRFVPPSDLAQDILSGQINTQDILTSPTYRDLIDTTPVQLTAEQTVNATINLLPGASEITTASLTDIVNYIPNIVGEAGNIPGLKTEFRLVIINVSGVTATINAGAGIGAGQAAFKPLLNAKVREIVFFYQDSNIATYMGQETEVNSDGSIKVQGQINFDQNVAIGDSSTSNSGGGVIIGKGSTDNGFSNVDVLGNNIISPSLNNSVYLKGGMAGLGGGGSTNLRYNPATGRIGPQISSQQWKTNIQDLNTEIDSSKVYNLQPKVFDYTGDLSGHDFGLIAEEVDTQIPELVARCTNGNIHGVNYEMLSVLLLEEIKKLNNRITALEAFHP